jgi:hypothetical protein
MQKRNNRNSMKKRPLVEEMRRPTSGPRDERLNGEPHFIQRKEKGCVACVVCKANKLWN